MTNPIETEKDLDVHGSAMAPSLAEFDLLLNLYRTLIESSDLAAGLGSALAAVCGFANWDLGLAWFPSKDEGALELFSTWHRGDPGLAEFAEVCQGQTYAPGAGITGRVWQRGAPEWVNHLATRPPELFPLAPAAAKAGIKATLAVPVIQDHRVLGVLVFCAGRVKPEDSRLVQIVSRVATQLGFALRHKQTEESLRHQEALLRRSHDELESHVSQRTVQLTIMNEALRAQIFERKRLQEEMLSRVRQQQSVANISERALSGIELPRLLRDTCERVAQTLVVEFCKVLELQPDGQTLLLKAGVGWREGLVGQATVPTGIGSQAGYTLASHEPVIVEDLRVETRFSGPSLLVDHGVLSGISVIIPGRNRPFGVLSAHTAKRRTFGNEDINFLESVANILSQAVERKDAESAIQRSEAWLRNLVATTQDAVVSIDRRGRIVLFNAAAERIFGYSSTEIIGRKVNDLMAEPYAKEHDDYIARYEKTGEARAIGRIRIVTGRRKNGESFPIELSVTEIEVDDQVHYAAFLRDISGTVHLYTRAVENESLAAIGSTAAKIGHEIANPLNGIYLTLQLIEQRLVREPSADERVTADIARIKKEIGRLNQLVREFRALSRQQTYNFRPVRLNELIDEIFAMQQPLCDAAAIRVARHISATLPPMRVDEDKLKQALLNLFKNAIEAMPSGGDLALEVNHSHGEAVIKISDSGSGIAPGADIFAPFYTTKKEGTGLGLIIVRQIIAAHDGTITFESETGKGTTFTISLPITRAGKEPAKNSN